MILTENQRTKLDESDDTLFYLSPRFVTHVDQGFVRQLTNLYRQRLRSDMVILDLMSSWVSHLPEEVSYKRVEGHGLNAEELAQNPRLDRFFVQNLNQNQHLPYEDNTFDAVLNTVSVQYLQYPEAVFQEIARILKPSGIAIFSFSNRMFFQKAVQAWRDGSELDRVALVKSYFADSGKFTPAEVIAQRRWLGDPFYAVIASKKADAHGESARVGL
ncbi:MAG: SAM-dependent methyltransferase [Cyanobacteria bacterium M5B4]|nr:MAG: SAM-dependent methyltransferase [Cyanobacteria bacterium M5B4]